MDQSPAPKCSSLLFTGIGLLSPCRTNSMVTEASSTKTVAEIAFEVGFNTPGYFSKCFKEQYGKLPMDIRQ